MRGPRHDPNLIEQILGTLSQVEGAEPTSEEDALLQSLLRFMDEMPGGFLIYHADRGEEIIYANRALLSIFQCQTMAEFRQLTGNTFRGVVHPDDLEEVERSIWEQIGSQNDLDYVEYRIRRRDGAIRWIEDYGHFVQNETLGGIFYVYLLDVTERRDQRLLERSRLITESQENQERLQSIIDDHVRERDLIEKEYVRQLEIIEGLSINYESICYVDLDNDRIHPYRLSTRIYDLFEDRLQNRPYSKYYLEYVGQWVHPEDQALVRRVMAPEHVRKKLSENLTFFFNYRAVVDGELQHLHLRFVNVSRVDGLCQAVLGCRRVDEEIRQQMDQQALLAEALAKANLAITTRNTFLSNMSHDMRTPLNAIFGFTSLAKMSLGDDKQVTEYLDQVEEASRKLLDMIEKVLDVSAMGDSTGIAETECDLKAAIQEIYDFLHPQAMEKDIDFTLDFSGLRHKDVYTDPERLRQLVLYLANNAVTYTNPGGRVSIAITEGAELPSHYAVYRLEISDTGIGISPEFVEKIFEPFSREKNSTLSGVHSIGLGLTIAKNIVDLMGGKLEVQSQVGKGSTFTAVLRFRQNTAAQQPVQADPQADTQKLLLVEDNELNREIATELLEDLGFDIDPAENGKIAVDRISQSSPGEYDAVLMDIQMPVMDGWQASSTIRNLPDPELANIPIIALTANALDSDRQKSREAGIDAHLTKPMDLPLLLRTLENLTGKAEEDGEAEKKQ